MKIRIAALGLLLIAPACFAQNPQSERAALLESSQGGKEIRGSNARYRVLPDVQAVEQGGGTQAQALARVGESSAQVLETKGKLVLYRSAVRKAGAMRGADGSYPAVINLRSGGLGVLTDTLVVRPKNMADADAIATSHGLEKIKAYPQLQTVFYKAPPGVDIADVSAALQADGRVEIAYPEIIEHVRVPK